MSFSTRIGVLPHKPFVQDAISTQSGRRGALDRVGCICSDAISSLQRMALKAQRVAVAVLNELLDRLPLLIESLQSFSVGIEKLKDAFSQRSVIEPDLVLSTKQILASLDAMPPTHFF